MPLSHFIRNHRVPAVSVKAEELITAVAPMLPNRVETKRQKTDLGDQFSYVWHGDEEKELFAFCAQFSVSFVIVGVACREEDVEDGEDYRPHASDILATNLQQGGAA